MVSMGGPLTVQIEDVPLPDLPRALLRLVGELDYDSADRLRSAVDVLLEGGVALLVLEMTGVGFCDSAGITALVHAHREAVAAGGAVHLVAVQPQTWKVLELVGLAGVIPAHPDLETALAAAVPG